jgi:hypothetical protein
MFLTKNVLVSHAAAALQVLIQHLCVQPLCRTQNLPADRRAGPEGTNQVKTGFHTCFHTAAYLFTQQLPLQIQAHRCSAGNAENEIINTIFLNTFVGDIYSNEDESTIDSIEDNDKIQTVINYADGNYSSQTFGIMASGTIAGEDVSDFTILSGYRTSNEEQPIENYVDGIYSSQTFGKLIGTFSDDIFTGEIATGYEQFDPMQQPETPYPNYRDPEWYDEEKENLPP